MLLSNSTEGYGIVSRLFHWLMAIAIIAVFGLGYWMVGLDYYSPYYVSAPDLHRSVGLLLLVVLIARWAWRLVNIRPNDPELSPLERQCSRALHIAFYPLLMILMFSGYFISTSDGRPISLFGMVSVPAVVVEKSLADIAGYVHRLLAYLTIGLASVHTLAALKHHFIDHGAALIRMWSGPPETRRGDFDT